MAFSSSSPAAAVRGATPTTPSIPSDAAPTPQAPNAKVQGYLTNDPERTGFKPETSFWINYFKALTGNITDEGVHHFAESLHRKNEAADCARCEKDVQWLFSYSPIVVFLRERIEALNGRIDGTNVLCRRCPTAVREDGSVVRQAGGFDPNLGILICANEVRDRSKLEDALAHEMVHAWDHLRWKVDFTGQKTGSLRQAACTEIRAAMLSGECRWTRETIGRGNWTLTQQFQRCVRRTAIKSVMARPRCKDDVHATKVVNEVWDSCFADTRPFDEVYK